MEEGFGAYGTIHYELKDEFGNTKQDVTTQNVITNYHDAVMAAKMNNSLGSVIAFIDFGKTAFSTGTAAETGMNVGFQGDSRNIVSRVTAGGGDDNDVVCTVTIPAAEYTGTIQEAGLFLTSSTSDMMCYAHFPDVNITKGAADTLAVTWTITYGAS